MVLLCWIFFNCLLSLGLAWNQPSFCYIRQPYYPDGFEKLDKIQETLAGMATSLNRLVDVLSQNLVAETTTDVPFSATTEAPATQNIETTNIPTTQPATSTPVPSPSDACGGSGWRRVAFINMTDPSHNCPQGLSITDYSIRSCGRSFTEGLNCSSVTFSVEGPEYSQVCGKAIAYRWGQNQAFYGYHNRRETIEGPYVDGLSLTHGSPRTHIWTFASGQFSGISGDIRNDERCPCDPGNLFGFPPPYVGEDYFCVSVATRDNWGATPYSLFDTPIWDDQDFLNPCYALNNPPWFNQTLPEPTSDDINLRLCLSNPAGASNIALEYLELYVS